MFAIRVMEGIVAELYQWQLSLRWSNHRQRNHQYHRECEDCGESISALKAMKETHQGFSLYAGSLPPCTTAADRTGRTFQNATRRDSSSAAKIHRGPSSCQCEA